MNEINVGKLELMYRVTFYQKFGSTLSDVLRDIASWLAESSGDTLNNPRSNYLHNISFSYDSELGAYFELVMYSVGK